VPLSHIESFINEKVKHEQISVSYQKGLVGAIKKLYELLLDKKPKLDYLYPKRSVSQLPKFFSKNDIKLLLDNTENIKHKAILTTIYSCGLRLSELLNLKINDIQSSDKIIRINQSKGNKDRIISLPDKLLDYYLIHKPTEYLFEGKNGDRYSERSVQLILKKSIAKAKIKTEGTVHTLRHSYATHLIQSGIDIRIVQELLGHENIKTTTIYTHITDMDKKKTPSPLDFL
jgi:site-specific recombinase XerD